MSNCQIRELGKEDNIKRALWFEKIFNMLNIHIIYFLKLQKANLKILGLWEYANKKVHTLLIVKL